MYTKTPADLTTTTNLADQAVGKADQTIKSAHSALDGLSDTVHNAGQRVSPMINRATEQAAALAQRGMEAVRNTSQQVRDKAMHASDATSSYIRNEPIKSVLIAAATGAALMALLSLASRSRHHD
jgi:ElaB/YqjD/DUF883 family membrane-anchored ribosome-binding protein